MENNLIGYFLKRQIYQFNVHVSDSPLEFCLKIENTCTTSFNHADETKAFRQETIMNEAGDILITTDIADWRASLYCYMSCIIFALRRCCFGWGQVQLTKIRGFFPCCARPNGHIVNHIICLKRVFAKNICANITIKGWYKCMNLSFPTFAWNTCTSIYIIMFTGGLHLLRN